MVPVVVGCGCSWWSVSGTRAASCSAGVRMPMAEWGRTVLYQWTHWAVASSTSSMPSQGPCSSRRGRLRMSSALYRELRASARAKPKGVPPGAHRGDRLALGQGLPVTDGPVPRPAVGVVDPGRCQVGALAPARPDGHFQGAGGQVRARARGGPPADDPPGVDVRHEGHVHPAAHGAHVGVGSAGGALPAFSRVGLRRPPLGAGRAHWRASGSPPVVVPRTLAASGTGDAGSPVAVAGHGDPAGSEELDSVVPDAPPGQEPAVDGVLVQAGVALGGAGRVFAGRRSCRRSRTCARWAPCRGIGAPASDRRVESAQEVGECPMSRPAGQDPDPRRDDRGR